MANRQLVQYIKEQLSHKMNINSIRTLLLQQGWSQTDVETAINEAYSATQTKKEHHTNFVGVAIAGIVVIILAAALFLVVFKQTEPSVMPLPLEQTESPIFEQQLSGWAICQNEADSIAKDSCYQDLNENKENFDCDLIDDAVERGFCYRAKETIILRQYAEA